MIWGMDHRGEDRASWDGLARTLGGFFVAHARGLVVPELILSAPDSGLLLDPEKLRRGLQAMIEREEGSSRGDPRQELELWHERLREAERMRSGYQDLAARGLLTHEELGSKLAALEETRETARRELEALGIRGEKLERLKGDRDAVLEQYADLTAGALDALSPEQRNRSYKMLKLNVALKDDGTPEVSGAFYGGLEIPGGETSCTRNDVPAVLSV